MMLLRTAGIVLAWFQLTAQTGEYDFEGTVDEAFDMTTLVIQASENACYRFDVYLALTSEQRRRGLMFVREMPETTGMLFVYRQTRILSIWMKNTYIPLDIVFFAADGRIVNIHENAEPHSLTSRQSEEAVNYVLELNGGLSEKLGIDTNSRIILPQ